jgi:glycosyltransferase involved in cell wall biosynthesis
MNQYLLSVIIPVYNVEKYVRSCLQSVASQTLEGIEVIIVDDGSTDGSPEIIREETVNNPNFRIITQENRGLTGARNTGIEHASGRYLAFLDSDDFIDPDMYRHLIELAESHRADLVKCGIVHFMDHSKEVIEHNLDYPEFQEITSKERLMRDFLEKKVARVVWNGVYHSRLFRETRFPEGVNFEDAYITPEMLLKAEKFLYTPQLLCYYRQRETSITGIKKSTDLADQLASCNYLYNLLQEHKLEEEVADHFSRLLVNMARTYHHLVLSKNPGALRNGQASVNDLINPEVLQFVLERNGLQQSEKRFFRLMLHSHYAYFIVQKSSSLIQKLFRQSNNGKKQPPPKPTEHQYRMIETYCIVLILVDSFYYF